MCVCLFKLFIYPPIHLNSTTIYPYSSALCFPEALRAENYLFLSPKHIVFRSEAFTEVCRIRWSQVELQTLLSSVCMAVVSDSWRQTATRRLVTCSGPGVQGALRSSSLPVLWTSSNVSFKPRSLIKVCFLFMQCVYYFLAI